MISVTPPVLAADPDLPMRLNTGRYRDQWHTMTRTGLSPTLSQHRREALLEVHPDDAAASGLTDHALARVSTAAGAAVFRVSVTPAQRRGDLFVPMHWTDMMAGGARTNRLPGQATDPVSGQPGFKNTPARVEPVTPEWRAFLACRNMPEPIGLLYWSRSRVQEGWLYELAGMDSVDVAALLPEGQRLEVADHARGMRRIVVRADTGEVQAALYLTRSGHLPQREWAAEQLGLADSSPMELLAGRPSTPGPDRGPIVCICHGVGTNQIAQAAAEGALTVEAVGKATCAGTNCGSCRPAIARLLELKLTTAMEDAA